MCAGFADLADINALDIPSVIFFPSIPLHRDSLSYDCRPSQATCVVTMNAFTLVVNIAHFVKFEISPLLNLSEEILY